MCCALFGNIDDRRGTPSLIPLNNLCSLADTCWQVPFFDVFKDIGWPWYVFTSRINSTKRHMVLDWEKWEIMCIISPELSQIRSEGVKQTQRRDMWCIWFNDICDMHIMPQNGASRILIKQFLVGCLH
ncbi:hypothetical protein TNCV_960821 [Trichonephila clavipes]|nr:hypothetical protein TNCV_960821 [Trichonephila clavipes]